MKNIWYRIVRFYVYLGLHSYFKKIKAVNLEKIPDDEAFLFVANHRNGLIDPILIAITKPNIFHFLTRASAFKNPVANFLLQSINMLPIYRIRDGKDSIQHNQEIFEACYQAFNQKESVLIFPEGNHGLPRRVRPLSKGFIRIAFGYLDTNPEKQLKIIPVGLNYNNMFQQGSSVTIYYGKTILANDYYKPDNEKVAIDNLKNTVYNELQKLTTHIDNIEQHDQIENNLLSKGVTFLDPFISNDLIKNTPHWKEPVIFSKKPKSVVQNILHSLFIINTFIPIIIWKKIKHSIKDIVLTTTFKFGVSASLIPLFYILQACIISYFTAIKWAILYLLISILLLIYYRNTIYTDNLTTKPS
jgi:1-acyl-sn-glycerol-3-phosphate acyltransferase